MGFKCAPQLLGLVRGEPKAGQKHRANGKAILSEAGKERYSASATLNRSLTHLNKYTGYDSGFAAWDAMQRRADEYRTQGKTKDGKSYERALRKDAVIGFALIINPPSETCVNWSEEEYRRFYEDTWECLKEIEPRLFSDKNVVMTAEHFDEGMPTDNPEKDRHLHIFGDAMDTDGKYCGNLLDAKLLAAINQRYPQMMRAKGWDMDDLDTTDWNKYQSDDAYRAERKSKRKQSGKSVNQYIRDDIAKKSKQIHAMNNEIRDLSERDTALRESNDLLEQENASLAMNSMELATNVEISRAKSAQLSAEHQILKKQNEQLKAENATLSERLARLLLEVKKKKEELLALAGKLQEMKKNAGDEAERVSQNRRFEELLYRLQHDSFILQFLKKLGMRKFRNSDGTVYQKSYVDIYQEALDRHLAAYRKEAAIIRKGEHYQSGPEGKSGNNRDYGYEQ